MKRLIIDRLENGFAVCEIEEGSFADIPEKVLPDGVKEGMLSPFLLINPKQKKKRKN